MMIQDNQPKELRIVLDAAATEAFETMKARLKSEMPTIKIQPSQFVSFLVADFLEAHFEKDKDLLIAEFFDSDAYYEAERKKAKGLENYEEFLEQALERAKRIKSKRRRQSVRRAVRDMATENKGSAS